MLDLCTGTGDLLIEVLRRDPARTGVGVDLSTEMLVRGAAKLRRRGLAERGRLARRRRRAAARARGARFDGVTVAFGIRNVGDPLAALREMHRVAAAGRPGGVLEFSMPAGALGAAYRLYFAHVLPADRRTGQRRPRAPTRTCRRRSRASPPPRSSAPLMTARRVRARALGSR